MKESERLARRIKLVKDWLSKHDSMHIPPENDSDVPDLEECIEFVPKETSTQEVSFQTNHEGTLPFSVGDRVTHPYYGKGIILSIKEDTFSVLLDNGLTINPAIKNTRFTKECDIVKTKILSTSIVKDKKNAMIRGIVGALLIGTSGAIIGTSSAKNISTTTFLIIYKNGSRETIEVVNETRIYDFYIQYLEV